MVQLNACDDLNVFYYSVTIFWEKYFAFSFD